MSQSPHPDASTNLWQGGKGQIPTLFERYEILGIIGQGGMGTVYKGFHLNLKRFVAIKTLRVDQEQSPELVQRFRREMELVGQMDHPHVVRASDAGERNGIFYLVMELLAGTDLGALVTRRGRLSSADACEMVRQAALGLDYLHRSFVHRDIKPSNLMLTTAGIVKILDLGLARGGPGGQEYTPRGYALGTFSYMAPEQASAGAGIDGRADIYSLGCTLFKLLTGRAPYSGSAYDSPAKQIFAHCQIPLDVVPQFPLVPEALRGVLLRMTAKEPADRFQSGAEVAAALVPFTAGCQLLALVDTVGPEGPEVRPLTGPLPTDLSRLTEMPVETPHQTIAAPTAPTPPAREARPWDKRFAVYVGVGILIAGISALAWHFAPTWHSLTGEEPKGVEQPKPKEEPKKVEQPKMKEERKRLAAEASLDELRAQVNHSLLDLEPMPIGYESRDDWIWGWDKDAHRLEAKAAETLLFSLGKVTRSRFSFEVGISQVPWTGNVGLFWGYQEDDKLKKAKKPLENFAKFQMLCVCRDTGPKGETRFTVARGTGTLRYNKEKQIAATTFFFEFHGIDVPTQEAVLRVEVMGNRVRKARFGAHDLWKLYSEETNNYFLKNPSEGMIGVFALRHSSVFRNVRFIADSTN